MDHSFSSLNTKMCSSPACSRKKKHYTIALHKHGRPEPKHHQMSMSKGLEVRTLSEEGKTIGSAGRKGEHERAAPPPRSNRAVHRSHHRRSRPIARREETEGRGGEEVTRTFLQGAERAAARRRRNKFRGGRAGEASGEAGEERRHFPVCFAPPPRAISKF